MNEIKKICHQVAEGVAGFIVGATVVAIGFIFMVALFRATVFVTLLIGRQ